MGWQDFLQHKVAPPKKGWVIQNGRPTKVEENTSGSEYIWVEEWRNLSKKKQQSAIAHWEDLKPRVEQARRDRDLDPIQKSDQEFWNIRKRAIEQYRPPSAPGMPVQERPKPHQDLSLQIQQFSAYQDCLQKMQDRIKLLESQLPETAGEGSKGCPVVHSKKPHEERIPPTRMRQSEGYNLLHKPINDWRNRPDVEAVVEKEFVKLEKIPAWNVKDAQERSKVKKDSEKKWHSSSLCRANGPVLPEEC